ncbi:MAG: ABC transporter ATP-binding protein [Anaerolineae bacterium]|nr:ABC transporter ATP-binding protein [Anaerolineae bacterium]
MLALEHVSKAYGARLVLKDLSLTVGEGEILCLLGPSGCGKTTLLNLLAGLIAPDSGLVRRPPGPPGYVFQEPRLLPWRTVEENVGLGLKALHVPVAQRRSVVAHYLERLSLREAAGLYPHQLSGGMRQRVALGRAFAVNPAYLLLDEPFKSLDIALRLQLVQLLLDEWQRAPKPVVFVTHDIAEAALTGQRIMVLDGAPLTVREQILVDTPPGARRPCDPEVLETEARLYALLTPGSR